MNRYEALQAAFLEGARWAEANPEMRGATAEIAAAEYASRVLAEPLSSLTKTFVESLPALVGIDLADRDSETVIFLGGYNDIPANVEVLYNTWCGNQGLTRLDEIKLMRAATVSSHTDLLDAIPQLVRSDYRLLAILEKWEARGWWESGVSLRFGWATDKGKEEMTQHLNALDQRREMMVMEYETELHNTDPKAVDAVRAAIEALGGSLVERDGCFFLLGGERPAHFIQWAAVRQGYVRGAKPVES